MRLLPLLLLLLAVGLPTTTTALANNETNLWPAVRWVTNETPAPPEPTIDNQCTQDVLGMLLGNGVFPNNTVGFPNYARRPRHVCASARRAI